MKLCLNQDAIENIIRDYCKNNEDMLSVNGNIYLDYELAENYYGDRSYKYTATYDTKITIDGKTYPASEELDQADLKRIIKEYFKKKGYNVTSVTFSYDDGDMRGPSCINAEVNIKTKVRERTE